MTDSVEEVVVAVVAQRLKVPPSEVPLDEPIIGGLGLDSFEAMEVVLDIESAYDHVSLTEADARELKTLREVIDYIERSPPTP